MTFVQTLIFTDDRYSFIGKYKNTYFLCVNLADLMSRVNATSHFVVYILVSHNYRPILRAIFCRFCLKSNRIWNITLAPSRKTETASGSNKET